MIELYLTVFISWLAHLTYKILSASKKYKSKFDIKIWFKSPSNYLYIIFSFLIVLLLVISVEFQMDKNINIAGIEVRLGYVIGIAIGYMPTALIKILLSRFDTNTNKIIKEDNQK